MPRAEDLIRDQLAATIGDLPKFVVNLDAVSRDLQRREQAFFDIPPDDGGPSAHDLLRRILLKRNLVGLNALHDLRLLGTEFKLLSTGLRGKQPSADILAINDELGVLFLPEVKQDVGAERQAAAELGAYSQGLQDRFWGLSPSDHVWIPISTEWRTTVRAAFANEVVWGNRAILPMRCKVDFTTDGDGQPTGVKNLDLELLDIVGEISEERALSHFAWDCFDCVEIAISQEVGDPRAFIDFIVATASRFGLSGYVLYYEHVADRKNPYPYVFHVAASNPFRAALKERQLHTILQDDRIPAGRARSIQMRKDVGGGLWGWLDIDLQSGKTVEAGTIRELAERAEDEGKPEKVKKLLAELEGFESVSEIASASGNRINRLFKEIRSRLELFLPRFEIGSPSSASWLYDPTFLREYAIRHCGYFGLMGEAVYERLAYEFRKAKGGQGSVIADLGGDPIRLVSDPSFFRAFMELMNYQHDCQVAYQGGDEKPGSKC